MAITIKRFGELELPQFGASEDLATGQVQPAATPLPSGGVYDHWGSGQARRGETYISRTGEMIERADTATLESQLYALRALQGTRALLIRKRDGDAGVYERCLARLMDVQIPRGVGHPKRLDVTTDFLLIDPLWSGENYHEVEMDDGHYMDSGLVIGGATPVTLTTSPQTITVENGGHAIVRNAILRITAGNANITALTIICEDAEFTFSGTILATTTLTIDCGAMSVRNIGAEAYANFALTSNHLIDDWLQLLPGSNSIFITRTGGGVGSTIAVEFFDGWE